MSQKFYSEVKLEALNNATVDTDHFLVGDSGTIKYRTGAEVLSDIGAAPASGSGNYIQNQNASAQSANMWISGSAYVGATNLFSSGIIRQDISGTTFNQLWYSGSPVGTVNTDGLNISYNATSALTFGTAGTTERMRITSAGNVGIGTSSPNEKLTVSGKIYANPNKPVVLSGLGDPYYGTNITLASDIGSTQGANRIWSRYDGTGSGAITFERSTNSQAYNSDPQLLTYTESMRIAGNGNVLIGTTSDLGYKLNVAGTLRTTDYALLGYNTSVGNSSFAWGYPGAYYGQMQNISSTVYGIGFGSTPTTIGTTVLSYNTSGNVGIGTSSPQYTLDVNGTSRSTTFRVDDANSSTGLLIYSGAPSGFGSIARFLKADSTKQVYQSFENDTLYLGVAANQTSVADIGTKTDVNLVFSTSYAERMRITSGGNVGIGTSSPSANLQVNGSNSNGILQAYVTGGGGNALRLNTNFSGANTIDLNPYISGVSNGGFEISQNGTQRFVISAAGNVGIGTTSPTQKLNVDGNITALGYYFTGDPNRKIPKCYAKTVQISNSAYSYICTVSGDALASGIRISIQGTSGSIVVNTMADILVNHFQDILINATSGIYTQLSMRVISNNNETFSIEATTISGASGPTDCNVEIFPLNNETINFSGTVQSGTTLTMTTRPGLYVLSTGGGSDGDISAGGSGTFNSSVTAAGVTVSGGNTLQLSGGTGNNWQLYKDGSNGLQFYLSGGGPAMYINSSGNVGIGTSSPGARLTVQSDSLSSANALRVTDGTGVINVGQWDAVTNRFEYSGRSTYHVQYGASEYFAIGTNGLERMRITSAGNVGIGTTSPVGKLDVFGAVGGGGIVRLTDTNTECSIAYRINGSTGSTGWVTGNANNDFFMYSFTSGSQVMTLKPSGNVGIGTTSPGSKLNVDSNTNGADGIVSRNLNTGGSAYAFVGAFNNVNNGIDLRSYPSTNLVYPSTSFVASSSGQTGGLIISQAGANPITFFVNGGERMRIASSGLIGIGNSSPSYPLHVSPQVSNVSIYADYDIVAYSDQSVKENIRPIENALERVIESRGVLYDRIDSGEKDNIGFIAQELEVAFPELVVTNPDGTKAVKYQNAVAVLFEAVKEQQKQIDEIKRILNGLTN